MKSILLLLLVSAPLINSQGHHGIRFQGGNSNRRRFQQGGNQATRLGLLGPQLGLSPVPGGSLGGTAAHHNGPRGCFCLPANQVCTPSGPIPQGSTRIKKVDTRIINTNPVSNCPEGQKECCFGSIGPPRVPNPPVTGGGPSALTGCGFNTRLFPGSVRGNKAEFGEYPWMAVIVKGATDFVAGGAIVSRTTIITAAHKVTDPGNYKVRVGDYDLSIPNEVPQYPHQEIQVSQVIFHPQFNSSTLANDVAVLKLARSIHFTSHINAACLPEQRQRFAGSRCWLSGWGKDPEGNFQPILREVDLPGVDEYECEERLRATRLGSNFRLDKQSFMCAGGESGKDACTGDGGSPLVCNESNGAFTVAGLVAWGIGCGDREVPGVYVNIPTYSNFIQQYL